MRLNRLNRQEVKAGDIIRFYPYNKAGYFVTNVITNGNKISFTIQDIETKQTIYCYPSSLCYGAEVIKNEK